MSYLGSCGVCCAGISVWGIIQMIILGILFSLESTVFIEESLQHDTHNIVDYDTYIPKVQDGYKKVSTNCFTAAVMYVVSLIFSFCCIFKARKSAANAAFRETDDELVCAPVHPLLK